MGISIQHLLLTLIIIILVFGTKRLKNVGTDLGDAIKGFRKALKEGSEESENKDQTLSESKVTSKDQD